jgi:predicted MPP superfamily phosphohydrolase
MDDADGRAVFTWLHVSDIHLGHGTSSWQFDQQLVLDALEDDLADEIASRRVPQPDAILCTGDVASTGAIADVEEYQRARTWIDALQQRCGIDRVFLVPGNHDVQRTYPPQRDVFRLLRSLRSGEDSLDEARGFPADLAYLDARLANFHTFCEEAGWARAPDAVGVWSALVLDGDPAVRLIGFNTATLCNDNADEGSLAVATSAILDAKRSIANGELVIALAHHPPAWLAGRSRNTFEAELYASPIAVLLRGHLHDPGSGHHVKGNGQALVTVAAGAVHDEEHGASTHAYNVSSVWQDAGGALSLRVWPRRFSDSRVFVPDTDNVPKGRAFASHPLPAPARPTRVAAGTALMGLAVERVNALGRRRTAFPTDLSLAELRERGLLMPVRLKSHGDEPIDEQAVLDTVAAPSSVLVLGPPGGGKTVFAYEAAQRLLDRGIVALTVDLATLPDEPLASLTDLVRDAANRHVDIDGQIVLIVDGVDELLAGGVRVDRIAQRLESLAELAGLIVTCRVYDYERQLAAVVRPELFSAIFHLQPWRVEPEFSSFVAQLVEAGLLQDGSMVQRVAHDERLRLLVARPLHARMLTYVAEDGLPDDASRLYEQYMGKLSAATASALRRTDCRVDDVLAVWADAAWLTLASGRRADALPVDALLGAFRAQGIEPACVWRVLNPILDPNPVGIAQAAFVHYSFYEYLVAHRVARELTAAREAGDALRAAAALQHDLPQEVRRHLTALLRRTLLNAYDWPAWLVDVYSAIPAESDSRLVACNLIAYIACRLEVPFVEDLRPLLDVTEDPFLRNSLMWALVRGDDHATLTRYTEELDTDEQLSALNRGYLLYYYGDIPVGSPPFADEEPWRSWSHTRRKLVERFAAVDQYEATPPSRKVIDLYTFCDFARVRGEPLRADETALIGRLLTELPGELPNVAVERLRACWQAVTGS